MHIYAADEIENHGIAHVKRSALPTAVLQRCLTKTPGYGMRTVGNIIIGQRVIAVMFMMMEVELMQGGLNCTSHHWFW
jgi:hypothetical protein